METDNKFLWFLGMAIVIIWLIINVEGFFSAMSRIR
jgi:Na+-transporting methylmalonyl-CoA/oxaloacetate decarboxylase gamma subunit